MPNDRKIFQLTFFLPRRSKIYPNWDFWYENILSGNPGRWRFLSISFADVSLLESCESLNAFRASLRCADANALFKHSRKATISIFFDDDPHFLSFLKILQEQLANFWTKVFR
jgi:hypothetical protein